MSQLQVYFPVEATERIRKEYQKFIPKSRGRILTTKFYKECSIHQRINSRSMWRITYNPTWNLMPNYRFTERFIENNEYDTPFSELHRVRNLKHK